MNIKSVCFDLDGTLYDFEKVMRHALSIALAELTKKYPECNEHLSVDKMIQTREDTAKELKGKVINLEEVRLESFKRSLAYCGINDDEFAEHLNKLYLRHRFEDLELFGDVITTLDAFKDRYILGIISNGNSYPRTLKIEHYFRFVLLAPEVGIDKPNPEIFHLAIKKANCLPQEMLYIGDSQEDDISGGKSAGVIVAWFNREKERLQTNIPKPDFEIDRLSMLLDILNE